MTSVNVFDPKLLYELAIIKRVLDWCLEIIRSVVSILSLIHTSVIKGSQTDSITISLFVSKLQIQITVR